MGVPSEDFHPDGFLQKEVKLETPDYDGESYLTIGISSLSEAVNGRRNMLSEKQVNDVIDRVNENVDICGLSSKMERKLIAGPVDLMNRLLKRALLVFCSSSWVKALTVLLDDQLASDAKSEKMMRILQDSFVGPLAMALNKKIDIPVLGEAMEQRFFNLICSKFMEEIVEMAVQGVED